MNIEFLVVDKDVVPILDLLTCEKVGLIVRVHNITFNDKNKFIEMYNDIFKGLGKFWEKCEIIFREGSKPKIKPVYIPLVN